MEINFEIHLQEYKKYLGDFGESFDAFISDSSQVDFSYITESSSVYSSKIEGNTLDINSFMNAKLQKQGQKPKEVEEVQCLAEAYYCAQENTLTQENLLRVHNIASKTLLISSKRGAYRQEPIGVFDSRGLIYMAIEHEFVVEKMDALFEKISLLSHQKLELKEVFYYASMIHLHFVHIHPFSDGNGRVARILEKWFLATHLGKDLWRLQSEKYYWENRQTYYDRINLGVNFYELDYDQSFNFLKMLPQKIIR